MPRRIRPTESPGQDAFLDIVANLVGILIILVMVIGVQAKDAMLETPTPEQSAEREQLEAEAKSAIELSNNYESSVRDLMQNVEKQKLEIAYRRSERDKVLLLVTAAEEEIARRREELDEAQRDKFDSERDLIDARNELQHVQDSIRVAEGGTAKTAILQHLPTPMARTVFGTELHFQLSGHQLRYVPFDELVEKFKGEAQQRVNRLRNTAEFSDTVGPIQGFLMKYTLQRVRGGVELDHALFIPVQPGLSVPVRDAFREGSYFLTMLARHPAGKTTVTVWTYPDSFNDYRPLKEELFRRGYLTASRPMPEGQPIGASPDGSRSAAQ